MSISDLSDKKKLLIILALIGFAFSYGSSFASSRINKPKVDSKIVKTSPKPTWKPSPKSSFLPEPTPEPSFQPGPSILPESTLEILKEEEIDPYDIMVGIGNEVTDNSTVSVFKNKDGSVDVINNIQLTPEVDWKWAMDVKAKEWTTKFISQTYNSGLNIRYALVTVSFLNTGRPATRVGLGITQANKFSDDDWKSFEPTMLCSVLEGIQIGDNTNPDSPSFNPSNWAFAKNCD